MMRLHPLTVLTLITHSIASSPLFTLQLEPLDPTIAALSNAFSVHTTPTNTIQISNSSTVKPLFCQILSDGTLKVNQHDVMGIGKNYLSTAPLSRSWMIAEPWSIEGGHLKLYASNFHAVPDSMGSLEGLFVLGSINAAQGRQGVVEIVITPVGLNGEQLDDYKPPGRLASLVPVFGVY